MSIDFVSNVHTKNDPSTNMFCKNRQVDNYLMHWPVPFVPVPFESDPRYSDGRGLADSYEPDQCTKVIGKDWSETHWSKTGEFPPHLLTGVTIHDTWRAMIVCKEAGLCKNIGICNFNVQLLHELCIGNPAHLPAVLQCESHPYCQQPNLIKYCQRMGIQFQAYSPLGYGEFRGDKEIAPMKDPTINSIAAKHGVSAAQVCLRWTNQRGVATMPFSLKENEMKENLDIWKFTLTEEEMTAIAELDKGIFFDFHLLEDVFIIIFLRFLRFVIEFLQSGHHYLRPDDWYGLPLWD